MGDSIENMKDLLEERKKFRELMTEILSLIRPKTVSSVADNVLPTEDKENALISSDTTDKEELLQILQNIYESCCNSIAVDTVITCEKINCENEFCTQHEDSRTNGNDDLSILNFDESFSPTTINGFSELGQNADVEKFSRNEYGKPISIVIYTPRRICNNRCRRKIRLESRNSSQYPPIRLIRHIGSSLT